MTQADFVAHVLGDAQTALQVALFALAVGIAALVIAVWRRR